MGLHLGGGGSSGHRDDRPRHDGGLQPNDKGRSVFQNNKGRSVFMGEKRKAKPDQHPWQRRRKEEPQRHYDGLSVDILHEILIRFSVKTLSQFRCICKQWYDLISDPSFQQDHYRRHSQQDPLLFITRCEFNNNETNTLHLSTYTKEGTLVNNFSKENLEQCKYVPIQSCLGLVCIGAMFTRTPILLCNPATGEIITLPLTQGKHRAIGFGYAASTKEFKVVRIFCHDPEDTKYFCEIFVLGTNKWREGVDPPPQYHFMMGAAPFLNGAIHLMSSCAGMHGNKIDLCIDVFDIETEKYTKIPLPRYYHTMGSYSSRRIYLRLLGGSLCLIFDLGRSLEIWSLKDCQQREWVKEYDIDHSSFVPHPWAEPLAIMGDGSMLLSMSRNWGRNPSLYWYDFRNKSFLEDGKGNCWGVSYVESLLSLRNRP